MRTFTFSLLASLTLLFSSCMKHAGSDHSTGFFYSGSAASRDGIYTSTNIDPGAVMTYTISAYDAVKNTVTISFSGEAFNTNGKLVKISKGKMTANIDWK